MSNKYHIDINGEAVPCPAKIQCTKTDNKGNPAPHFTGNKQAAQEWAEKENAREYGGNFGSVKKKETMSTENKLGNTNESRIKTIQKQVESLGDDPSNEELVSLGESIDEETSKRLSFDPNSIKQKELSQEQLDEIQSVNRQVMSELTSSGEPTNRDISGPRAKDVNETIKHLPDGAKHYVSDDPIIAVTIRKNSINGGQHSNGKIPVKAEFNEKKDSWKEKLSGAPDGAFYENSGMFADDLIHPDSASRVALRDDSSDYAEQYWMGKKPKGSSQNMKKVSDSTEVYINGEKHVFDKPLYRFYTFENIQQTQLKVPNGNTEGGRSIITHEYTHAIQMGYHKEMDRKQSESNGETHEAADRKMYDELKGPRKFSKMYEMSTFEGFPDDYMGSDYREFLPKATEAYYHPSAPNGEFLYGSDRHENADTIRKWTPAFWLHISKQKQQ